LNFTKVSGFMKSPLLGVYIMQIVHHIQRVKSKSITERKVSKGCTESKKSK